MVFFDKKEYGLYVSILLIFIISMLVFYVFVFDKIKKDQDVIVTNEHNVEIINNQNNTLKNSEVDIKEIERRLNELDIDLDDILNQLD